VYAGQERKMYADYVKAIRMFWGFPPKGIPDPRQAGVFGKCRLAAHEILLRGGNFHHI